VPTRTSTGYRVPRTRNGPNRPGIRRITWRLGRAIQTPRTAQSNGRQAKWTRPGRVPPCFTRRGSAVRARHRPCRTGLPSPHEQEPRASPPQPAGSGVRVRPRLLVQAHRSRPCRQMVVPRAVLRAASQESRPREMETGPAGGLIPVPADGHRGGPLFRIPLYRLHTRSMAPASPGPPAAKHTA
jgi:hypothetical protein